ncbi:MAG: Gfo/Idh/MocA family oxidoreductase [candidate division WS1 bacterium]|nr:Gfo/Idh/MocA family oxidoreductase [candidate division WS1 bacterium]
MKRVGIVDWDTSHVVQFTMRLNHEEVAEEQWIESDYRIVAGYVGTSEITDPERMAEYEEKLTGWGVEKVDSIEDLVGMVDAVMIESQSGYAHLDRARPFIEAGIPTYIDKPFVIDVKDGVEIKRLAEENNVPIFSSSSLRYAPEVVDAAQDAEGVGEVVGVHAFSPSSLHEGNPGLAHYGIHGVETLYALMGPGCVELTCMSEEGGEVSVGRWADGRVASMRGTRAGAHAYGFTVWGDKGVRSERISTQFIYRELLRRIVEMFETGKSPLDPNETLEIAAFIAAAWESANNGGKVVELEFSAAK